MQSLECRSSTEANPLTVFGFSMLNKARPLSYQNVSFEAGRKQRPEAMACSSLGAVGLAKPILLVQSCQLSSLTTSFCSRSITEHPRFSRQFEKVTFRAPRQARTKFSTTSLESNCSLSMRSEFRKAPTQKEGSCFRFWILA